LPAAFQIAPAEAEEACEYRGLHGGKILQAPEDLHESAAADEL
jgi:hypothetical protein